MEEKNKGGGMIIRVAAVLLYISSCCAGRVAVSNDESEALVRQGFVRAEITYPEGMAGCPYLLKIDSIYLQPLNLHDSLQVDKMKIWVKYHLEKQSMSVCMMGPIVTIDDLIVRE